MTTLHKASLLSPFFQQHLLTSGLCVTFGNSPKSLHFIVIIIFIVWSVIFDMTTAERLQLAEGLDHSIFNNKIFVN